MIPTWPASRASVTALTSCVTNSVQGAYSTEISTLIAMSFQHSPSTGEGSRTWYLRSMPDQLVYFGQHGQRFQTYQTVVQNERPTLPIARQRCHNRLQRGQRITQTHAALPSPSERRPGSAEGVHAVPGCVADSSLASSNPLPTTSAA